MVKASEIDVAAADGETAQAQIDALVKTLKRQREAALASEVAMALKLATAEVALLRAEAEIAALSDQVAALEAAKGAPSEVVMMTGAAA